MTLQSSYKGSPSSRIWMAAWKAFLFAFVPIILSYLQAGNPVFTWETWKPLLIAAVVAGIGAAWKVFDIYRESRL